uniref:NADH-ubiquinone oxidoreductase chain 2 n=1 Tax=Calanus finmarchicus TaxID=6837 RepID=A0A2D1GRR4_CALFI|nr:NADH dehydrogenase subunit 2 [Calanus finmarchicus]
MVLSPLLGFYTMLASVLLVAISSSSPFMMWVCLELNMLMFLPIMSSESGLALENTMKYFLVQSWASIFFLTGVIMSMVLGQVMLSISVFSLMLKLGAAPFHSWFISILKSSSMWILMLLSTLQKCIPLIMVMNFSVSAYIIVPLMLLTVLFTYFSLPGTISINKILALSSMVNLSWLLLSVQHSLKLLFSFFVIYTILLMSVVAVCSKHGAASFSGLINLSFLDKGAIVFVFMSLGGIPPLLGFLGKLLVLKSSLQYFNFSLILVLVYGSLLVLYTYTSRLFFTLSNSPSIKPAAKNVKTSLSVYLLCGSLASFNMMMVMPI